MDLLTIAMAVVRRWWVVLLVGAATIVLVWQVISRAVPEYEAAGSVVLSQAEPLELPGFGPEVDGRGTNNFVIAEVVNSGDIREDIAAAGLAGRYVATAEVESNIFRVTVRGSVPDGLVETVEAVLERARDETEQRQGSTNPATFETLSVPLGAVEEVLPPIVDGEAPVVQYVATGSALITPLPPSQSALLPNAYTVRLVEETLANSSVVEAIREQGHDAAFHVASVPRDPAPILYLTARGSDPGDVMATYAAVSEALDQRLAALQQAEGVDTRMTTRALPLSSPAEAVLLSTNRTRPAVALTGLGVVVALTLAVVLDGAILHRKARRTQNADDEDDVSATLDEKGAPVNAHRRKVPRAVLTTSNR